MIVGLVAGFVRVSRENSLLTMERNRSLSPGRASVALISPSVTRTLEVSVR